MHFDEDAIRKHLRTWGWLLENFGGVADLRKGGLVLPTQAFFPIRPTGDHAFAQKTFDRVRELMGMSDWPCRLEQFKDPHADETGERRTTHGEWTTSGPAGLYIKTDEETIIAYSKGQLEKPGALVATLVHELCHYLLGTARSHPPGGWDAHELHTDTAVGFMGFGIFACNNVFEFRQWTEGNHGGWSASRQGYLSESEHAYSLAVFCTLAGTDPRTVVDHLKKNTRHYFELAMDDLADRPDDVTRLINTRPLPESLPPILSVESREDAPQDPSPPPVVTFTREDVDALGPLKPWYAPLAEFYEGLVSVQPGESVNEQEFAALKSVQPALRDALLVLRFNKRFDEQGLQGAIILEDAEDVAPTLRMLEMTVCAFGTLGDERRAMFLQTLLPAVTLHFEALEQAEREDALDGFFSPLDHDDAWTGLGLEWNHGLRKHIRDRPELFVHPPK